MDSVDFTRVDFSQQRGDSLRVLGPSRFVECDFSECEFRNSVALGAREQSVFQACSFDKVRFRVGTGGNVRLIGCTFRGARLTDWFGTNLELVNCQFDGATIQRSKFWGRPYGVAANVPDRAKNEFIGNDFSRAQLRDVSFAGGIDLTRQKLPLDPSYRVVLDLADAVSRARTAVSRWADDDARVKALRELRILDEFLAQGQSQALIDIRDRGWAEMAMEARDAVLQLLKATPTA